jgi:Zn-dependent peptidase ImmA (M78 family)/transcriptional regulator with XRE-family HTH domain
MERQRTRNIPETPFGQRLRAARKMAGLSMEDLAGKLGGMVTKQAIGKYETGQMLPSPEVLAKLVEVLKIVTWGAAPLRSSEAEIAEVDRLASPALFRMNMDAVESPKFRRAGLLARIRGKAGRSAENEESVAATKSFNYIHLARVADVEDLKEVTGEILCCSAPLQHEMSDKIALQEETYPALASRRARAAREWEEDAGLNRIRFREGERLSAKSGSALKYRIADHLQKVLELETILGLPAPFINPIAGRRSGSAEEVESAAHEVRERWELGSAPIVNLLGLLEDKGIKVYETRGVEGFEGLSGRFGFVPFVAVGMENPPDRLRFTAAHELGHVLCDFASGEKPESECHAFGAAFLLPRTALEKVFRPARRKITLGDLGEIKEAYGVSLQAIMYRAHALGYISDRQLRSFRETLKARGWLVQEPVAYTGQERATRFRRLLHYAVAADILDVARAAEMAGVTVEELEKEIGDIF